MTENKKSDIIKQALIIAQRKSDAVVNTFLLKQCQKNKLTFDEINELLHDFDFYNESRKKSNKQTFDEIQDAEIENELKDIKVICNGRVYNIMEWEGD